MLDEIMTSRYRSDRPVAVGFAPSMAIADKRLLEGSHEDLSVVFSPWHGGGLVS
jgi:hypothetical protein